MPKFKKDYPSREAYEKAKQIHMESIIEKITNPEIIDRESTVEEIAEILKNNKIDQIIIAGEKQKNKEEQTLRLHPDLDSELALYLLNNFNKRKPEEMYNDGAVVSVINKNGAGKELIEDKKGVKIYLDTGGNWLKIEKDGETTTLYIDHHGTGQRDPTSGVKMTAEIMEKAGILKEKPEWLNKLIDFVNDVDNLTYLDKKDKKGNKTFTESYFRNEWPASLYALAEKKIPLNLLIELCEKGIIKDLTKPFTDEELNGEIGKIKVGDQTIKDLCLEQRKEMSTTLDVGIKNSIQHNKKEGINLEKTRLGKIIYQDYFKIKGKVNIIPDHLAFKATIAKGYDTYIAFNKQKDIFFINSKNPNLSNVVEELNKKYPGCATDIRGVMVYGKMVEGLNEEEFLNIIDPKILEEKNKVPKKEKKGDDKGVDTPKDTEQIIVPEEKNSKHEKDESHADKPEIIIPSNAIYFSGKNNKEITNQSSTLENADFAIFNVNGDEAEYTYIGKVRNENWFEQIADIKNPAEQELNTLKYIKTIETGRVRKENGKWVIIKPAKILFSNTETKINVQTEKGSGDKEINTPEAENTEYEAEKAEIEKRRQEALKRLSFDELMSEFEHNNHRLIGIRNEIGNSTFRIIDVNEEEQEVIIDYIKPDGTHSNFGLKIGSEKTFKKYKEKYAEVEWSDKDIEAKYEIELAKLDKKYNKNQEKNSGDNQDIKNEKEKQEKIDAIVEQFMKSISETKELEKRLAEIIEQENIAMEQKNKEKETQNKEENDEKKNERVIENSETKIDETNEGKTYQEISMEDFMWSYPRNYTDRSGELRISQDLFINVEEFKTKEVERSKVGKVLNSSNYKTVRLEKPYCEIKINKPGAEPEIYKLGNTGNIENDALPKINEIIKNYSKKTADDLGERGHVPYHPSKKIENNILYYINENILSEIKKDQEEKPFLYFAVEKSNNLVIINIAKNENTGTLDLRKLGRDWIGLERKYLVTTAENEGFFDFNIFGFIKMIKNLKEISHEKGINAKSDQAIYKIIGPNNEIIADNIQGYDEATKIYWKKTNEYQKVVEEEFNKLNNNKR